ncbi:MAG: lipid-binding SYLF domain-containing protein [Rhodanobacteraceae bacterium]
MPEMARCSVAGAVGSREPSRSETSRKSRYRWSGGLLLLLAGLCVVFPAWADKPLGTASKATAVLEEVVHGPDQEMPRDMLRNAYAVAILPSVIKAGLLIAGRHGQGLLSVKNKNGWSDPAFITISGGSLGLQAGVSSTDVLLIFRSEDGVKSLIYGKFLLGTDIAVAAGPVGRNAQASTDAHLEAEVYAWSRARGLFAGLSLQGASLKIDHSANRKVYGPQANAKRILGGHVDKVPEAVDRFRQRLTEYTTQ